MQVNEKRDKEKKGVDNSGYEGKKDADIEKGDEKDEKWKNNYVPYDDESKEKETKRKDAERKEMKRKGR